MKKETVLWLLVGGSMLQAFVNIYFGFSSWMLFAWLSAFFLGLLCITSQKILKEDLIEVSNGK